MDDIERDVGRGQWIVQGEMHASRPGTYLWKPLSNNTSDRQDSNRRVCLGDDAANGENSDGGVGGLRDGAADGENSDGGVGSLSDGAPNGQDADGGVGLG